MSKSESEAESVTDYVLLKTTNSSSSKGNVEVAVVVCVREPSQAVSVEQAQASKQRYTIQLFQFLDDERFSLLDTLLLQLGASAVHVSEPPPQHQRHLSQVLDGQKLFAHYLSKSHSHSSMDVLGFLRGKVDADLLLLEKERKLALSLLPALLDLQGWRSSGGWPGELLAVHLRSATPSQCMCLDSAAAEAVNLLPQPGQAAVGSLLGLFARHCRTKLGPKTLERWLRQPLLDVAAINARLDVVEALLQRPQLRLQLREAALKSVPDVAPALLKLQRGAASAGLPELFKLYLFARAVSSVAQLLEEHQQQQQEQSGGEDALRSQFSAVFCPLKASLEVFEALVEHVLDLAQLPDLRVDARHDPRLAELQSEEDALQLRAEEVFADLRLALSSVTSGSSGSSGSSVSLSSVSLEPSAQHGLVCRSTRGEDERLLRDLLVTDARSGRRERLRILSILKNGVYFATDSLAALGERLLQLRRDYAERQTDVVAAAAATAASYLPVFESAATQIASLDALQSFATQAAESAAPYCRPTLLPLPLSLPQGGAEVEKEVDKEEEEEEAEVVFEVEKARHPCVELVCAQRFVPNDVRLSLPPRYTSSNTSSSTATVTVVTGPNTGGKSTFIRTAAALAVLAQVGSLLPCEAARLSVTDRLFCRVGAGDLQQRQTSTFLLEMLETSRMLRSASRHSLLVIDELGRGTSTADGFGLACAIARHIATHIRCRCLFATHFHELTRLSVCRNLHVAAHVSSSSSSNAISNSNNNDNSSNSNGNNQESVVMTYEVREGACEQSFGVHVAAMTDFPRPVLSEAKRKLSCLDATDNNDNNRDRDRACKRLRGVETHFQQLRDTLDTCDARDRHTVPRELRTLFPRSLLLSS